MDHLFLYCIAGGIALVLVLCVTRVAIRWIIRLTAVGLLLLGVIGGVALWWLSRSTPTPDTKPRPASITKSSSSDRR